MGTKNKSVAVSYKGQLYELKLNNSGILSANSLEESTAAVAAGITAEYIKSLPQKPFSKGVIVQIGDKSVYCSWTFAKERPESTDSKTEEALFALCEYLLSAKGVSKDIKEHIKTIMEPFEEAKKKAEERRQAKIKSLASAMAGLSEQERELLASLMTKTA